MSVTATSANSYCTKAEADTYFSARLHVENWTAASTNTHNQALIEATRRLDSHMEWDGAPTVTGQTLCWPRSCLLTRTDAALDSTTYPQELKDATAEFALQLINADRAKDSTTDSLLSVGAGPVSVTFNPNKTARKVIPDIVAEMVSLWGYPKAKGALGSGMVKLVRA
jgi:hypothetical protein